MRTSWHKRRQARGLTLVEVLIVVALIAMLSGTIIFGSGMFSGSRLRTAATLVASAVRLGQTRANTTGRPVRLVFDLEQHHMALEESSQSRMLREKEQQSTGGGADPATEAEKAARAEAERVVDGPKAPRAAFTPVKEFGFDIGEDGKGRPLGKGIRFRQVQTEHDEEPRSEGRAYLYFWPGGITERAVIQLFRGARDDEGLTIEVSPLTGRAKVHRGRIELPEPRSDGEVSEREDT